MSTGTGALAAQSAIVGGIGKAVAQISLSGIVKGEVGVKLRGIVKGEKQ